MAENTAISQENRLFRKVDNTLYEISVQLSEDAKESVEDALVRLVAAGINSNATEEQYG